MEKYVWFIWSLLFLLIWALLYVSLKNYRKRIIIVSLFTMPLGLTEPLFVPEYWSPPSLFNLAENTGFDIESLIFCFSIGGIATVLYGTIYNEKIVAVSNEKKEYKRHRYHYLILVSPIILFVFLAIFTQLNHIYCGIIAMFVGALTAIYCRPGLLKKTIIGGILFLFLYIVFFQSLLFFFPSFVNNYWNLQALTGIIIFKIPLEEYLFAISFGMIWSGIYEHYFWLKVN